MPEQPTPRPRFDLGYFWTRSANNSIITFSLYFKQKYKICSSFTMNYTLYPLTYQKTPDGILWWVHHFQNMDSLQSENWFWNRELQEVTDWHYSLDWSFHSHKVTQTKIMKTSPNYRKFIQITWNKTVCSRYKWSLHFV